MSWDDKRRQDSTSHFETVEIDLPIITGTCTLPGATGEEGYYTPPTCNEQTPLGSKTYYFATPNCPQDFGRPINSVAGNVELREPIHKVIKSISFSPPSIKPGEGLSARGSVSITFIDKQGDPGPTKMTDEGTWFGKWYARNIFNQREVRIKLWHRNDDASGNYFTDDSQTHTYYAKSLSSDNKGHWILECEDVLSRVNIGDVQWPALASGALRADVDNSVTAIPVDGDTDYSSAEVVLIGDEYMRVNSVTGNLTSSATLNVATRGSPIVGISSGITLTETEAASHKADDDVQIAYVSDNQRIDDLLEEMIVDSGIPSSLVPISDWQDEMDEWHSATRINTLWGSPEELIDQLNSILVPYLIDMWYDPINNEIKLSAISVWKETDINIVDGRQITADTLKTSPDEDKRYSRAYIYFNKLNLMESDDLGNYKKLSYYIDETLESEGFYGEPSTKEFEPSPFLDRNSADLLTSRYVSRFGRTPIKYSFETEEKFLDFNIGDVANVQAHWIIDAAGAPAIFRAQVLSVQPVISPQDGRKYKCTALTYEPSLTEGSEFVVTQNVTNLNLHTLAGAPSAVVDITFIFDGITTGSASLFGGVTAGNFAAGSTITIICINATDMQGKGGDAGYVGPVPPDFLATDAEDGGIVYDANGIDTDIYLSGSTGNPTYPTADGYLRAPGGGGGSNFYRRVSAPLITLGGSGGGGQGRNGGGAWILPTGMIGDDGENGTPTSAGQGGDASNNGTPWLEGGNGGTWGNAGTSATDHTTDPGIRREALPGSGGKGVVTGGATVNVYGQSGRFINGNGDTVGGT